MKLAVTLTADSLIRSLRGMAHALAEDADRDYARAAKPRPSRSDEERNEEISHDRRRV